MTRVLVVDDEQPIREIVADLLGTDGHMVATAGNGAEALEVIHRWRPGRRCAGHDDAGGRRVDFLARYRADTTCRGLPVAILSTAPSAGLALEEPSVWAVIP